MSILISGLKIKLYWQHAIGGFNVIFKIIRKLNCIVNFEKLLLLFLKEIKMF